MSRIASEIASTVAQRTTSSMKTLSLGGITQSVYQHVRRDRLDAAVEAISEAIGR